MRWKWNGTFIAAISAAYNNETRWSRVTLRHLVILAPSLSPPSLRKIQSAYWPVCLAFIAYLGRGQSYSSIPSVGHGRDGECDGRGADCYADFDLGGRVGKSQMLLDERDISSGLIFLWITQHMDGRMARQSVNASICPIGAIGAITSLITMASKDVNTYHSVSLISHPKAWKNRCMIMSSVFGERLFSVNFTFSVIFTASCMFIK